MGQLFFGGAEGLRSSSRDLCVPGGPAHRRPAARGGA